MGKHCDRIPLFGTRGPLLTIKFYDQLLVNRAINVLARRQSDDGRAHVAVSAGGDPAGTSASRGRLPCALDVCVLAARLFDADHVALLDLIRRDVNLASVDQDMAMIHELASLSSGGGKASPIDGVVETPLEENKQGRPGDAFELARALEVVAKLPFEDEIDPFDLLFFPQLLAVAGQRLAAAHGIAVLSGRLRASFFNRAGGFITTVALKEKLCTFAAAQTAHRISIPSHSFLPPV